MSQSLRIITRRSPLALVQAQFVKDKLQAIHKQLEVHIEGTTTEGDRRLGISLAKVGGKGLFVKELETRLLDGTADLAVHCLKDMPVDWIPDLCLAAVLKRDSPWDVLVSNQYERLVDLPLGAAVGTGSLRRQSQLLYVRPDLKVLLVRGNIQTRLKALDEGKMDALILAAAGLDRMNIAYKSSQILSDALVPAVGQGALTIQCRSLDSDTQALISVLDDALTHDCVKAERSMNACLGGGCTAPIAGYAEMQGGLICLKGLVASPDGSRLIRASALAPPEFATDLGINVAQSLISQGASDILAMFKMDATV